MIIKGGYSKAIEISHWLKEEHELDWPTDYMWQMKPFSNNKEIIFTFKDKSIEPQVVLRYLHRGT